MSSIPHPSYFFFPQQQPPDLLQPNYLIAGRGAPGGYFVGIFQVFIWGGGADHLCLLRPVGCEALLAGPQADVLFRERLLWKDLEGLLKREKPKKSKSPKRCSSSGRVTAHDKGKTGIKSCCHANYFLRFFGVVLCELPFWVQS